MIFQHKGPLFRCAKPGGAGYHLYSKDAKHIDCLATGCKYNVARYCAVPTLCVINDKGGCDGFTPRPLPNISGD